MTQKSICVFCGASNHVDPKYLKLAQKIGKALAEESWRLIYGGGDTGLMGALARATHQQNGQVLGIMPRFLQKLEKLYDDAPYILVETMHERKQLMYQKADAFLILPGGIGTLDETLEILTWSVLNLHNKPVVFLSEDHYWQPLFQLMQHLITHKFTSQKTLNHFYQSTQIKEAFDLIKTFF